MSSLQSARTSVLVPPQFGHGSGDLPYTPTLAEILHEWLDSINFVHNPTRRLAALSLAFHLLTLGFFLRFCWAYANWRTGFFFIASLFFLATVYNTIWYHRYCSHSSFEFSNPYWARSFLWTNPFFYREEAYAIAHRIHHQRSDKAGDPYGPHLGWLGSYLAIESIQKINTGLTEKEYETLKKGLGHIAFVPNHYEHFRKWASIERADTFIARSLFAQLLWGTAIFYLGGKSLLVTWYAALFVTFFLIRSFNWHGHGEQTTAIKLGKVDERSLALNQRFYGYLASEWHDNHHKYPTSSNNGFLPGQIDAAFRIIQFMHKLGIVSRYFNAAKSRMQNNESETRK